MNYKIAQLIVTPGQKVDATSEVYVSQPDANKESIAGKLFALIEIESKNADDLKIINFLINTLSHNYYQNEKMILRERSSSLKIEHIFESSLAKTNKKLAEFVQSEKIRFNPNLLNITVGVIYKSSLHFANLGKNKAFLIYRNKNDEKPSYKIADITNQTNESEKKPVILTKLFSNVVSGSIPQGGYFFFANETLPEYLSNKQLVNIITTLQPAGAVEQIKNTLAKINSFVPFLGIIIKNTVGELAMPVKKPITVPQQTTSASIDNLNTTEEQTEKLLTPSGIINFKKWLGPAINLIGSANLKVLNSGSKIQLKDRIIAKKRPTMAWLKKVFVFIQNIFGYLIGIIILVYKTLTDKERMLAFLTAIREAPKKFYLYAKGLIMGSVYWFKQLEKRNKILFIAATICLVVLAQNLIFLNIRNKQTARHDAFVALANDLEQKQNQIDANLLYDNNDGVKKLLAESHAILAQMTAKTDEEKTRLDQLSAKDREQTEKISRVVRVDSPVELANLSSANPNAKTQSIVKTDGKLYIADSEQKNVYALDINSKSVSAIGNFAGGQIFPAENDGSIYYLTSNNISVLDTKTGNLSQMSLLFNSNFNQIAAIKIYNNRLYTVDKKDNQIYRYSKVKNNFENGSKWNTDTADLANAVSMDIDGDLYLLKNNGEVDKFTKGKKQDFSLETVEPVLNSAQKIFLSEELEYIYVLDPANKRLVVFNKSGKFVIQYTSDKFGGLKDFAVDETAKKIYFLSDSTVFSIDAKHLDKK